MKLSTLDYLSEEAEADYVEEMREAEEQATLEWEMEYGLCD